MDILYAILKAAVVTVLASSVIEALVLSMRRGFASYDWKAAGLSVVDFLVREYPLAFLLPLGFWTDAMRWFWQHRLWTLPMDHWTGWAACFIGQEFCYYWYHRASHRVRFFWATHAVHHSPNQLTLSTAYRLGVTGKLTGSALFFTPLVWLGIKPEVVLLTLFLNLMYQAWLHTTYIPKLGWFEYVFNTPSAHRVHHASNVAYLDANYGGVLIIFDRLFGTYVEERGDEACRYGLVTPTTSRNPFVVEFEHWATLIRDVFNAKNPWIAINHVIQPPGWLPDGGGETTEELRRKSKAPGAAEAVNG
jgi:sterol desaturase/sphingolipid hydroxylase (fatty acid hydroxylase superfamily)